MIRTDRLLVCEFSHLTATPSCAIMLTLGKIGQKPIFSQYGKLLYHIYFLLSIYFYQFLPGIFPGIFYFPPLCRLLFYLTNGKIRQNKQQGAYYG